MRQHDAGWWGGAGPTVGDRHPRLRPVVRFLLLLPDCARRMRTELCNRSRGIMFRKSVQCAMDRTRN
eukprot:507604-Prymnesium_polylepis.1